MATFKRFVLLGLDFWMLAACHLVARTPTPQPITPFQSTIPAAAILPTPTVSPAAVLANYLENARIVNTDTFDDPLEWVPNNEISNGELLLVGLGDSNWHGLSNRTAFREGNGVVINFKFTPGEYFEMYFERDPWKTSFYKRFGVYVHEDRSNVNLFIGTRQREPTPIPGNLSFNPGTWYSLLLAVGQGGDFLAVLWDPTNPEHKLQYREAVTNWGGLNWTFRIQVNASTIVFDDFEEIKFDAIK